MRGLDQMADILSPFPWIETSSCLHTFLPVWKVLHSAICSSPKYVLPRPSTASSVHSLPLLLPLSGAAHRTAHLVHAPAAPSPPPRTARPPPPRSYAAASSCARPHPPVRAGHHVEEDALMEEYRLRGSLRSSLRSQASACC